MQGIETNDNAPQIERAVQGKLSNRNTMKVPAHIRLKDQGEGKNQAAESLAAWKDLQREKELEARLKELDTFLEGK